MKEAALCLAFLLFPLASVSQTSDSKNSGTAPEKQSLTPAPAEQPADTSNFTSAKGFVLEDSIPVKLRINRTISSGDCHVGDTVDFEVVQDVSVNGTLVIPKGGLAFATVTEAQAKRRMARGGKLGVNIDYVKLVSSEKAPLRAVKDLRGGGHTGVMVGGIVATGIVFFPAAPLFLFMHGKDITIPKGTEITAYVAGNVLLDKAKFQDTDHPQGAAASAAVASSANMTAAEADALIALVSMPAGAEVSVDDAFVGNAPAK